MHLMILVADLRNSPRETSWLLNFTSYSRPIIITHSTVVSVPPSMRAARSVLDIFLCDNSIDTVSESEQMG